MPWLIVSSSQQENIRIMSRNEKRGQNKTKDLKKQLNCRGKLHPGETLLWSQSLENLLKSKYGMAAFQVFLKSEFSNENIEFWLICDEYKKIRTSSRLTSRAKKIFESYIEANAPKEINIDHQTRDIIRQNLKSPNMSCFDEAQRIVYSLMEKDSYPRFLRSDIYNSLIASV
ncbi:regulator of G-protein signaling 21-like [Clupea harengus]|uniref:Regulator of G-protein signaling 21-like n=1 Tax=Clupea harengus TaxID=7950 RepID=A0A8M1KHH5_CLUHA|nr:regulator of G-protein signaling 21-like [Clupea harengus]